MSTADVSCDASRFLRILAVDDSPLAQLLVAAALETRGFRVQAVSSGDAALAASRSEDFDAVILDVDMPGGLDGLAVGRALRNDPKTCAWPIAMHTSRSEQEVRSGFSGYDAFVPKPCPSGALGDAIERLIGQSPVR